MIDQKNIPTIDSWKNPRMKGSGKCFSGNSFWYEHTLWEYCRLEKYEPFEVPIAAIKLDTMPWQLSNLEDIAYHFHKVSEADMKYPIILDDWGNIIDGYHRLVKSILDGKKTIMVVRMTTMPSPDGKEEDEK